MTLTTNDDDERWPLKSRLHDSCTAPTQRRRINIHRHRWTPFSTTTTTTIYSNHYRCARRRADYHLHSTQHHPHARVNHRAGQKSHSRAARPFRAYNRHQRHPQRDAKSGNGHGTSRSHSPESVSLHSTIPSSTTTLATTLSLPASTIPPHFSQSSSRVSLATSPGLPLTRPAEQFSKYANIFFLFTACIQQIPNVSPTNQYTTIVPLALVLLASAFKEVQEDLVSPLSFP